MRDDANIATGTRGSAARGVAAAVLVALALLAALATLRVAWFFLLRD